MRFPNVKRSFNLVGSKIVPIITFSLTDAYDWADSIKSHDLLY